MLTATNRLPPDPGAPAAHTLLLTAEERTRSRFRFVTEEGVPVQLYLARGTMLRDGDLLETDTGGVLVRVRAAAEPVLTARAAEPFLLLRAAYHLGNRHVALELGRDYLRFAPDPVLADMLMQLGLAVIAEAAPLQPEAGAYGHHQHTHERFAHAPFRALR